MREIWFALLVGLTLAGASPAMAQGTVQGSAPDPAKAASLLAPTQQDRVLGKPDAPITIVEYASMTCPHCAHFDKDVLPGLKKKWIETGKAKLILRDYPLDEPALRAAMMARCAPPERFYPLIDTLFATQDQWSLAKDWRGSLEKTARLAGISKKDFDACLANKAIEDQVVQSRLVAATQLGVESTPTFFVNGTKFQGAPTEQAFDQLLTGLAEKS
jgi:protein-disulfide isomerase